MICVVGVAVDDLESGVIIGRGGSDGGGKVARAGADDA